MAHFSLSICIRILILLLHHLIDQIQIVSSHFVYSFQVDTLAQSITYFSDPAEMVSKMLQVTQKVC